MPESSPSCTTAAPPSRLLHTHHASEIPLALLLPCPVGPCTLAMPEIPSRTAAPHCKTLHTHHASQSQHQIILGLSPLTGTLVRMEGNAPVFHVCYYLTARHCGCLWYETCLTLCSRRHCGYVRLSYSLLWPGWWFSRLSESGNSSASWPLQQPRLQFQLPTVLDYDLKASAK